MEFFRYRSFTLSLALLCTILPPLFADNTNNGENILNPITRLDLRVKFQTGVDKVNADCNLLTVRMDKVMDIRDGWQSSIRVDIPYGWVTHPASQKFDHFGDVLLQGFIITPPYDKWTVGAGIQMILPTDGNNLVIGDGKYEMLPSVAVAYSLDDWSEGSYAGLLVRELWSIGGYRSSPPVRQTRIEPSLNLNLSDGWFVNLSPEIRYNWVTKKWFVPFDLMIGKMVTDHWILSVEYDKAIVRKYPEYNQQVEFRVGYFF